MSEAWINRLWQLVLVCTFAIVLSVCNKALNESSDSGTSSGTAFADGPVTISAMPKLSVESTTTVSAMPEIKVSAMPTIKAEISSMPSLSLDNGTALAVSSMPALKTEISSMPSVSLDNDSSIVVSSIPTLKADITSMPSQTVEVLAAPKLVIDNSSSLAVSSLPSVTINSQAMPTISAVMFCYNNSTKVEWNARVAYFFNCDASDNDSLIIESTSHTVLSNSGGSLKMKYWSSLDQLIAGGWRPCRGETSGWFCK